jgi:hypothetical protein
MRKEEPDNWLEGMLFDEYRQSLEILSSLKHRLREYPKGSLGIRKRINKKTLKVYEYPCLKYSENNRIFNMHIPWSKFPEIQEQIKLRNKILIQIKSYQNRVRYLERILGISKNRQKSSLDNPT